MQHLLDSTQGACCYVTQGKEAAAAGSSHCVEKGAHRTCERSLTCTDAYTHYTEKETEVRGKAHSLSSVEFLL